MPRHQRANASKRLGALVELAKAPRRFLAKEMLVSKSLNLLSFSWLEKKGARAKDGQLEGLFGQKACRCRASLGAGTVLSLLVRGTKGQRTSWPSGKGPSGLGRSRLRAGKQGSF